MKILILGSADSIWVKEYIEFVLLEAFKKNVQRMNFRIFTRKMVCLLLN